MTTVTKSTDQERTTSMQYVATLSRVAPYPLNWENTDVLTCDDLASALAQVAAWQRRYPRGFASRTRWATIASNSGTVERHGSLLLKDFKVHLDTKRKIGLDLLA
jgi:hypothetical protein